MGAELPQGPSASAPVLIGHPRSIQPAGLRYKVPRYLGDFSWGGQFPASSHPGLCGAGVQQLSVVPPGGKSVSRGPKHPHKLGPPAPVSLCHFCGRLVACGCWGIPLGLAVGAGPLWGRAGMCLCSVLPVPGVILSWVLTAGPEPDSGCSV